MALSTTEEIIEDIRRGRMAIIMDEEDRENEGDLVMAAGCVRPEDINFMARYGRGLICLTLTKERCRQLRLPLMVSDTDAKHATNFTVSIEAAEGITTGISAGDRAHTVRVAAAPDAKPSDLTQPGHIFPLMSQPGGVLKRAGHTEAGCDLAKLAGFEPAAVIVEILNDDGSMARLPDLEAFAQKHGLRIGTIADLIRHRIAHEKTVERLAECELCTEYGAFRLVAYLDKVDGQVQLALVKGPIGPEQPVLVRVHPQDGICDLPGLRRDDCGWSLDSAMQRIAAEGNGVLVILRRQEDPAALTRRIQDLALEERGVKLPRQELGPDLRGYGLGAQILADLGVRRMRVLSHPKKLHGLAGFGLEVLEYVAHE
jgi:3,4-dihydroxy 2-butanone 4-phosphate synthase / GTP cyclohydrolase II